MNILKFKVGDVVMHKKCNAISFARCGVITAITLPATRYKIHWFDGNWYPFKWTEALDKAYRLATPEEVTWYKL